MLDSEQGQGGQFQMGKRGRGQVEGRIKVEWGYGDEVVLVGGQDGRVQAWEVLSVCLPPLLAQHRPGPVRSQPEIDRLGATYCQGPS